MKEAQVAKDLSVTIKDVAVPEPQANQVVIKVVYSGSNPKDWYVYATWIIRCPRDVSSTSTCLL